MMGKIDYFDLKDMETRKAIFLKTDDNCYLVAFFASRIDGLRFPRELLPIIKDFYRNKSDLGKKAHFGQVMENYDQKVSIGDYFGYVSGGHSQATSKINEIIFGEHDFIEKHFLETIKTILAKEVNLI